ncbi:MAG: hypothetical protein HZA93_24155 [Verrucomicrobia bacterium]|nr:hypothetical protein [Verrucomicrobiota bacterium]
MKTPRLLALLAALAVPLHGADLTLNDGKVLKNARIVAIGEKDVTITHAAGMAQVPVDNVPLMDLAKAKTEIDAKAEAAKKQAAQIAKNDEATRTERAETKKKAATQNVLTAPKLSPLPAERRLMELKAKFPGQTRKVVETRKGNRIEIEIPSNEVFSSYRGWVSVATLDSLPRVVAQIEARLGPDIEAQNKRAGEISGDAEKAKARATSEWLSKQLRPYVAQLKAVESAR